MMSVEEITPLSETQAMTQTERAPRDPRTIARARGDWRPRWLEAFVELGTVVAACQATGVGRRTVYDWRQRDEDFAVAFAAAEEMVTESLEQECIRRAMDGSDRLLEFVLRARRPERYSDTQRVVLSGGVAVAVAPSPEEERSELDRMAGVYAAPKAIAAGPDAVDAPVDA